jgi:hypothetical protein
VDDGEADRGMDRIDDVGTGWDLLLNRLRAHSLCSSL